MFSPAQMYPDINVYGANMGPTWVLSAPDGPHIGPMNLAMRWSLYWNKSLVVVLKAYTWDVGLYAALPVSSVHKEAGSNCISYCVIVEEGDVTWLIPLMLYLFSNSGLTMEQSIQLLHIRYITKWWDSAHSDTIAVTS